MIISPHELENCVQGLGGAPNHFLGFKSSITKGFCGSSNGTSGSKIFFIPIDGKACKEMDKVDERGFFELHLADYDSKTDHILESFYLDGNSRKWKDPYSINNCITNKDLQDFNAGCDRRPFTKLGAIPRVCSGVEGVSFVVWAPSAKSIHIIGDFNHWNHATLPMRSESGCCELFLFLELR